MIGIRIKSSRCLTIMVCAYIANNKCLYHTGTLNKSRVYIGNIKYSLSQQLLTYPQVHSLVQYLKGGCCYGGGCTLTSPCPGYRSRTDCHVTWQVFPKNDNIII